MDWALLSSKHTALCKDKNNQSTKDLVSGTQEWDFRSGAKFWKTTTVPIFIGSQLIDVLWFVSSYIFLNHYKVPSDEFNDTGVIINGEFNEPLTYNKKKKMKLLTRWLKRRRSVMLAITFIFRFPQLKADMKSYIPLKTAAIFFLAGLFLKQRISSGYVMVDFICMG